MIKPMVIGVAMLLFAFHASADSNALSKPAVEKLVIPYQVETTNSIHVYVVKVLTRTLELTEKKYGPFKLIAQQESTVQSRQLRNLEKGWSDIIWMISSTERDRRAHPVKVPLIGGLYGYRVLLVNSHSKLANSLSSASLRSLSYTQGGDWPDFDILRANALTVYANPYKAGFKLVQEGFIDAYPRAAHEAMLEIGDNLGEGLAVAPDVLLTYYNPLFFYVDKNNDVLAKRLREGLSILINRGELQQMLEAQPFYTSAMQVIKGREATELANPFLSALARQAMDRYLMTSEVLTYTQDTKGERTSSGTPRG